MRLFQRVIVGLAAAAAAFLVSIGSARLFVAAKQGFGARDVPTFVFWTSFFVLIVFASSTLAAPKFQRWSALAASIIWGFAGAAVGLLFALVNFSLLGPLFGAWSFPVLYCWTLGGVAAFVVAVTLARRHTRPSSREARA